MSAIREDTIGGFNTFLADQREEEGSATITLFEFNDAVELVYEDHSVGEAPSLSKQNYRPGGQTALNDGIYTAIYETKHRLKALPPVESPDTVIIVVLTDGKENASKTSHAETRYQIETMQMEHDWEFLFIGANQDAALTAQEVGIDERNSLTMAHNAEGTREAYQSTSDMISDARTEGEVRGYEESDRERQDDARER
jgi:hypothetical protein